MARRGTNLLYVTLPGLLLLAIVSLYLVSLPQSWIWLDAVKDWGDAARNLRLGRIPLLGTSITGSGRNGPFLIAIYQLALGVHLAEWVVPAVSCLAAVTALLWMAWRLRRDMVSHATLWAIALFASAPMVFEWTRVGFDFSFLPLMIPITAALWERLEKEPQRRRWWALMGLLCAMQIQTYIIMLPFVGVVGATLAYRYGIRRNRRLRWFVAALVLPFTPLLVGGGFGPQPFLYGTPAEALAMWWRLACTYPEHLWLRANHVAPEIADLLWFCGWMPVVAPFVAAGFWRRFGSIERLLLTSVFVTWLLLGFPERAHYHHFVHLFLALGGGYIFLGWFMRFPWVRWPLAAMIAVHLWFLFAVQVDAERTGFVLLANEYPVAIPGETALSPTIQARSAVFDAADAAGLNTPVKRQLQIHGDRELAFWAQGWLRIQEFEAFGPDQLPRSMFIPAVPAGNPTGRHYRLWACPKTAGATHLRPNLCWSKRETPDPIRVRFAGPDGEILDEPFDRAVTVHAEALARAAADGGVEIDVSGRETLVIRSLRPCHVLPMWVDPMYELEPPLNSISSYSSYAVFEHAFAVPAGVDSVRFKGRWPTIWDLDRP